MACAHFRQIFELFIDRYMICTYFPTSEGVKFQTSVKFALVFSTFCDRARHNFKNIDFCVMSGYVHLRFISIATHAAFDFVMFVVVIFVNNLSLFSFQFFSWYCCNYQY